MIRHSARMMVMGMALALSAGCRADTQTATTPTTAPTTSPDAKGQTVVIDNFTFSPAKLTVAAGTTVTWVNHDDVPHTATSSTKPRAFNSGTLDTDGTYSFTFKTAGTYAYFCQVHPHMTGVIVVK